MHSRKPAFPHGKTVFFSIVCNISAKRFQDVDNGTVPLTSGIIYIINCNFALRNERCNKRKCDSFPVTWYKTVECLERNRSVYRNVPVVRRNFKLNAERFKPQARHIQKRNFFRVGKFNARSSLKTACRHHNAANILRKASVRNHSTSRLYRTFYNKWRRIFFRARNVRLCTKLAQRIHNVHYRARTD